MAELKQQFEEAVNYVQSGQGSAKPGNEEKLKFYALFKQATSGDVSGKKPGLTEFVGRAKYSAWEQTKGMSADEAMQAYISEVEKIKS